jgi:large subunit ribosomal protein L4
MSTVAVYNNEGQEVKQLELSAAVFEAEVNTNCVRAAVNRQLARRRQGNACTKTRGMVAFSGRKPWSQKGTGRARSGSAGSPVWRKGGTVFGPQTHGQYGGRINRKVTQKALVSCLSDLARNNEIRVIENIELAAPKTRQVTDLLKKLNIGVARVLFVTDQTNVNLALSARNIPYVDVINCDNLNTFDLTTHDVVIATTAAIERIQEVYA